jgi:hypothetical protein
MCVYKKKINKYIYIFFAFLKLPSDVHSFMMFYVTFLEIESPMKVTPPSSADP